MSDPILSNSYNILGLDNSSSEKEILRRSKEIINLIKIDETPEYDADVGEVKSLRTEQRVKESVQNLSDPKKRIKEYFFWFDIQNSTDEDAISNVRNKDYSEAIKIWKAGVEKSNSKNPFYEKNLALLYNLLLSLGEHNDDYLNESLKLWGELLKSEKFWENYLKLYKLNDYLSTNASIQDDFKKHVSKYLSDIYTILSQKSKKNYLSEFNKTFGVKGERLEKNILNPIYSNINDAVEELEAMKISEDGKADDEEIAKVKTLIKKFQDELNKIIELDLYDDSQTKVLRDKAGAAIRSIALDFNNNLFEYKTAQGLMMIASTIAATGLLKHKIETDSATIESNVGDLDLTDVVELVEKGKFKEAIELVDDKLSDDNLSKATRKRLEEIKEAYEARLGSTGKPISNAPPLFTIWGFGTNIYGNTLFLTALYIPVLPLARYTVEDQGDGRYLFYGKLPLTSKQKWWFWIGLIVGGIWLFSAFGGSNDSSSSASSTPPSSDYVTVGDYSCSESDSRQADLLRPSESEGSRLETEEATITRQKRQIDNTVVDEYSEYSVDSYNTAVDRYNAKREAYNDDLESYNSQIDEYNNYLEANCNRR
ncbi:MAG: hypothetical protein Q7K55_02530 [Candidatus Levybacteria bacterium]|nr:hypothetical protein [Candidatus Levybacteria bacterium]